MVSIASRHGWPRRRCRTLPGIRWSYAHRTLPLLWAAVCLSGCATSEDEAWLGPEDQGLQSFQEASPTTGAIASPQPWGGPVREEAAAALRFDRPGRSDVIIVQIRFDILRIRVPKGVFSASNKIWNHLSEQTLPAEKSALLQRNGLRVGRGRPDSWPPIRALLEQVKTIETSSTEITLGNGLPLIIDVDQHRYRDQTLFIYRPEGKLAGASYPASTNQIRIEYGLAVDQPHGVQVDIMPAVQQKPVMDKLKINELGQLDQPVIEPTRVLRELAFRMVTPPGEFIAIGPSRHTWDGHLAGSLLLCEEIEGNPYESIYFITPRQERAVQKGGPQSGR